MSPAAGDGGRRPEMRGSRRPAMPGADELFRATAPAEPSHRDEPEVPVEPAVAASGRVKHDEKMTVYVTAAELLAVQ